VGVSVGVCRLLRIVELPHLSSRRRSSGPLFENARSTVTGIDDWIHCANDAGVLEVTDFNSTPVQNGPRIYVGFANLPLLFSSAFNDDVLPSQ